MIVAAVLVMFMQAGFAFLEIGFSRGKNVGAVVAKILTNFSIASIVWWARRLRHRVRRRRQIAGDSGFFFQLRRRDRPELCHRAVRDETVNGAVAAFFFFQFVFCAVSLAIVWGTTLERIKFIAYSDLRGRLRGRSSTRSSRTGSSAAAWLPTIGNGVQDFAGSTVVHLTGATGALAALLLLGPRKGKYGPDGKPRAIPGHNMPLFGLGVLILWLGWFGFNPRLDARHGRRPLRRDRRRHEPRAPRPACSARSSRAACSRRRSTSA